VFDMYREAAAFGVHRNGAVALRAARERGGAHSQVAYSSMALI
jgi:hypothetical protein